MAHPTALDQLSDLISFVDSFVTNVSSDILKPENSHKSPAAMLTFHPHPELKCVLAGAGSDSVGTPSIGHAILDLVYKVSPHKINNPPAIRVAYIGTATYDIEGPLLRQTAFFRDMGCEICPVNVADEMEISAEYRDVLQTCDVVIASGGNTLYAIDHWKRLGLDGILRECMERGVVLSGGSAGAICWFDGGHSDSMDPDSFKRPNDDDSTRWEYIRVPCLGFLPGLVVPHHDVVQSNGVLRAKDFDEMLLRHPNERGIGLDHWSALVIDGECFSVIAVQNEDASDKEGSVLRVEGKSSDEVLDLDGNVIPHVVYSEERRGVPGIWVKDVDTSHSPFRVQWRLLETGTSGKVSHLLKYCDGDIVEDIRVVKCREENPF